MDWFSEFRVSKEDMFACRLRFAMISKDALTRAKRREEPVLEPFGQENRRQAGPSAAEVPRSRGSTQKSHCNCMFHQRCEILRHQHFVDGDRHLALWTEEP